MNRYGSSTFINALRGIWEACRSESNFKIHLASALVVVVLGLWLELSASDWRWVVLCIALVFILELLNTAIETLVDLASPAYHPLAKKAKDIAAGAVLVAAIFAVIVGAIIFVPKFWASFLG
ncbi:diacylglycerol kinase family protein [Parapedobacter tibetensis]|uniref:diacylglycerol kinase family protein n=1 Tax=Parapedobacter tibetensis TaxID=2972951 RepID=UPI00214DCAEE|nr:diacylglycerol kinase family protein [Parapedobacter tibetensis]